jgi:hypothetical protein
VARRLYRKQVVDGVYRLDEGAWLDDFCYFLDKPRVINLLGDVQDIAIYRQIVPYGQYALLYCLKTLLGVENREPACSACLAVQR